MPYLSQPPRTRRAKRRAAWPAGLAILGLAAGAGLLAQRDPRGASRPVPPVPVAAAPSPDLARFLDPRPETAAPRFVRGGLTSPDTFRAASARAEAATIAAVTVAAVTTRSAKPAEIAAPARLAEVVLPPLPVPRPAEFAAPRMQAERAPPERVAAERASPERVAAERPPVRLAERPPEPRPARRARVAAERAPEEPNFFEKLFGLPPAAPVPALSYAALETPGLSRTPLDRLAPGPVAGGTAVYDITARTVTLPNGERLEAHSGLGDKMDDPRHVHVRMRGATPPGTYDLTERESLFHGVRAIRLNPVGGSAAIHGRDGLLAHTYMLGPRGDSNGCVSFRDYNRFLQAYLRGEVRRLVVVAGSGSSFFAQGRRSADRDG